jgi:DNA-binding CsgD family transcriptional regulator
MKRKPRIYYSETHKALMWERWKKGESLQQIAQLFDRNHGSVQGILVQTGGIRPPQRCRSPIALSLAEREEISRALVAGQSIRSIACQLGRAPSTISREIQRNGGQGCYRAALSTEARTLGLPLVEDNPYGDLWFDQAPPAPLTWNTTPVACSYGRACPRACELSTYCPSR